MTRRSAQSALGALYPPPALWDGRAGPAFVDPQTGTTVIPNGGALEAQAIAPILADNEMAHQGRTWTDVVNKLQGSAPLALATFLPTDVADEIAVNPTEPALFSAAFGDPESTARRIAIDS